MNANDRPYTLPTDMTYTAPTHSGNWFPIPDWQEETPRTDMAPLFPAVAPAVPGCALPDLGRVVSVGLSAMLGVGVIAAALGWWVLKRLRTW